MVREAPTLETERLFLRAFKPQDLEPLAAIWIKPEVVRFIGVSAKPIRASASGTFVVRLRGGDPCGLSITAIGSKGSRATLSYAQLLCAEP